jgi:hypothetical protein
VGRIHHSPAQLVKLGRRAATNIEENAMSFSLPELPYAHDALAPYMSRETLEYQAGEQWQRSSERQGVSLRNFSIGLWTAYWMRNSIYELRPKVGDGMKG